MSTTVPIYGFGGGAALNFKVVAYATEELLMADTPKENTIGVVTILKIKSWTFSDKHPANPEDGMVWFVVGLNSVVEFNALKKNAIQVEPLSAKIYVNGVWTSVTAKSYLGGKWTEWKTITYLFNNGEINEELTGGWSGSGYYLAGRAVNPGGIDSSGELLYAKDSGLTHGGMGTVNAVDLTAFKTLSALATTSLPGGYSKIWVTASKNIDNSVVAFVDIGVDTVVSIDISKLNGKYYIVFGADASTESATSFVRYFKLEV